jgi:glycosyltransferase involved in cell wall biosynthesis
MSAWELLCADESLPPLQLNIAGGGPMEAQLQSWRSGLSHPENVKLLGHVDDMPGFYEEIHMLAMPSFSEGFGLVAAEALACGRPVVGGDASSLPEVIRHQQTGLLVPPGDPTALASALSDLIRDPDRSALMGQAGHRDIAARFDHEQCLDNLETLLRQAPAKKAKGTT